ncbi:M1 family metallopeptidase [Myxococcus llanfairpwllgwyngyllgogerychwyrndrobwllllantysiliogogogochensis]|uniref:Aminopeptidase n=1 Tax=Myxococcus llanfairpwllgwyngyllgogerychwyrndrobwllllantysiliogogogochensis TaxID=2590453 RepID=A0A540WTG4_9BACT|nr:M1 family metallopeptidase [Myxococcus llanfairpwllgwyngyllgogerychwyrndrobwllllantysiliogogogochensis]TQF12306.1 M1 family metallopeptidase [Myxococcus llanfairpwllgwyngyllgogerychwyrndrobwllllantysiliogogogochensis]
MRFGHPGAVIALLLALLLAGCAGGAREAAALTPPPMPRPRVVPPPVEDARVLTPPGLRLDWHARPTRQTVTLELDPRQETFRGTVDVELSLSEPTRALWLHASELTVSQSHFRVGDTRVSAEALPVGEDLLAFIPREPLQPGPVTLHVEYTGRAYDKEDSGVFREQDNGHWYAMTQFQPLYARRAFPCFDEPAFKIPWVLTLRVRTEDSAFANTPVRAEEAGTDGWKTVRFQMTPPLPTYLVAFAVGPFEAVDAGRAGQNGVPVRIVVPKGRAAETTWAASVTPPLLAELETWFGTPYPYPKLDVLAVPGLLGGAMEHPGLVTFGAPLVLAEPGKDTVWRQRGFAETQAHELAHQWFGNLVTPAWWDDLWLNESFADWLAFKVVKRWRPEWRGDIRRVEARGHAMREDWLVTARSIRQPIEAPGDIHSAFDGITYGKGAAVLAMFESWVGADTFQRGVRHYLQAHARGTATTEDFFQALSLAAGRDVAPVFSSFLDQPGVPLVAMTLQCPKEGAPRLALEQRRYLPLGARDAAGSRPWQVPLCVRYAVGAKEGRVCTVLTEPTGTLELTEAKGCPDWVHPNADARGYYHALLRGDGLERLTRQGGRQLTIPERLVLMADAQALLSSGELDVSQALTLVARLSEGGSDLVNSAAGVVGSVHTDLVPNALRPHRARFVRGLFGNRARSVGFVSRPGESEDLRLMRPTLMWMAATEGEDPKLRAEARRLTLRWLEDRTALPPEDAATVLQSAAVAGDAALHQRLRDAARAAATEQERGLLFGALGSFRDAALARASLELLLDAKVDTREALAILFGQLSEAHTREVAFGFLREHFDTLRERLPRDLSTWLLSGGGFFCDAEHREEVARFFGPRARDFEGGERALAQSLERVDQCIAQREALRPGLTRFLARY